MALPIEPTVGAGLRDILHTKEATGEALHAVLERAYAAYALTSQAQYRALLDAHPGRRHAAAVPLLRRQGPHRVRRRAAADGTRRAWDTVVADFEATNRLWRRDTVPAADLPPDIREALLRADPACCRRRSMPPARNTARSTPISTRRSAWTPNAGRLQDMHAGAA